MATMVAGRRVDRCSAVPGREVVSAGEPADIANVAEEPGGLGRADAVELLQRAAGGGDQLGQLSVGSLDLLVDDRDLGDEFRGKLPSGVPDDVAGRTVLSSARAWGADRNCFAPPGTSLSSSWCSRLSASVRARSSSSR
ncbi:hypothetical protein [Dactylosporangium matsuzakiense]|uniref:hypothetical protein n=1 Tax=Dactylosporangium matsuzakiense TaxID=53360 RepID=UPI0022F33378|nr:hypothetical protein [Dactylosporangium matsuzakiense]